VSEQERPWIREFEIDGKTVTDTTHRTPIVEYYAPIKDRTFIDLGAGDGHESRAIAHRGAKLALAIEGKDKIFKMAKDAQDYLKIPNHEVRQLDVRYIDTFGLEPFDVVMCFGFIYHVVNPFNFLKRVKNITKSTLLLETHIAPLTDDGLIEKHRGNIRGPVSSIYLDGGHFLGRYCPHVGDPAQTKGSLDAPWTFWLTGDSLVKAVTESGFKIIEYLHEVDNLTPEPIRKNATDLGFGLANTKVLIVAEPKDDKPNVVSDPVESLDPDKLVPPTCPEYVPPDILTRIVRKLKG